MTETEWLTCEDPEPMLKVVRGYGTVIIQSIGERRERLIGCACCRRLQEVLPYLWNPAVLDVVERVADGLASDQELHEAARSANESLSIVYRRIQIESRNGTRRGRAIRGRDVRAP